jgi:hypothetical protein
LSFLVRFSRSLLPFQEDILLLSMVLIAFSDENWHAGARLKLTQSARAKSTKKLTIFPM